MTDLFQHQIIVWNNGRLVLYKYPGSLLNIFQPYKDREVKSSPSLLMNQFEKKKREYL